MSYHKDIVPTADLNRGAHVPHYYTFNSTGDMNSLSDSLKGTVTVAPADIGRHARVGSGAPYDFYVLTDDDPVTWEQVNGGGGGSHASDHIDGGADAIDGDQIEITWTPTNSTRTTSPTEVSALDQLTAHLAGIDTALAALLLLSGTRAMTGILDTGGFAIDLGGGSAPAHAEGRVFYDPDNHTLAVYNDATAITHQLGQEFLIRVRNDSGSLIADGSAVYISGVDATEFRPTIELARADDAATAVVIGVVTADIADSAFGYVTARGRVNDIDTSAFTAGDTLYLSETTAGAFRASPPPAGNYSVRIGWAGRSHATLGVVEVDVDATLTAPIGVSSAGIHTGLVSGGLLSAGSGGALYDISAGVGTILDVTTDPENPTPVVVRWDAFTDETPSNIGTEILTEIAIDSTGSIVEKNSEWTLSELRQYIILGRLGHSNLTSITSFTPRPIVVPGSALNLLDFISTFTPANVSGNVFSADGTTLGLVKSAGQTYRTGANYAVDPEVPNVTTDAAIAGPVPIFRAYSDGSGGLTFASATTIDPSQYDGGAGSLVSMPLGRWQIQRILYFSSGNVTVLYGQQTYGSLSEAQINFNEDFAALDIPDVLSEGVLRASLFVRQGATDLSADPAEAHFLETGSFGVKAPQLASGGAGIEVFPLVENVTVAPIDVEITEDSGDIVATLTDLAAGSLVSAIFDGSVFSIASGSTVNLTAGTATVPVLNFVYLTESGGTVTMGANTTGWPDDSVHLARVVVQSSTEVAADGPLSNHLHNDSPLKRIQKLGERIRLDHAVWTEGCDPTLTITTNGGSADDVHLSTLAGVAWQLGEHDVPAFDTDGSTPVYVVNDPVTPYRQATNLNDLLDESDGGTMDGRYFALVFFIIINEDSGESKLCVSLPSGDYGNTNGVNRDLNAHANFSIPDEYKGNAFLLAEVRLRHQAASSGTWTLIDLVDLRGQTPSTAAGGSGGGSTFSDAAFSLFDDGDQTKLAAFQLEDITTGNTRTITVADRDVDMGDLVDLTQSSQFSAITAKATPVSGDILIIEDSAASNAKRRITIGDLPGGGGGPPTFEGVGPLSSGNRYNAGTNGMAGVTTGFIVACLAEAQSLDSGSGQTLVSNINYGTDGWQANIESSGQFNVSAVLTTGAVLGVTAGNSVPTGDPAGSSVHPKHWLLLMRVIENGSNADLELWLNGQYIGIDAGAAAYAPRTSTPAVGTGAFGNVAADSLVGGFAYYEGTMTDEQIRRHFFACAAAGDLVEGPDISWDSVYSVKRGAPAATWTPSDGSGPTFNRTGSTPIVERDVAFFG